MEFLLDSANLKELEYGIAYYPVDGVTTNPSILKAEWPFDYYEQLKALRALCAGRTFHVQLAGETCEDMLKEAEEIWQTLGKDVFLKIPVTDEGVRTIREVKARGGRVTATAVYYTIQGIMAIHAGADYLAPYCNRMGNNDIDFIQVISQLRDLIDRDGYQAKILAASFKNAKQVTDAIAAGAHGVTVQPALIKAAMHSPIVGDAVKVFANDYRHIRGGK